MAEAATGSAVPAASGQGLSVQREAVALGLAALSGVLAWLGFAGVDVWPFALLSMAPLLVALRGRQGWKALRLGWLMGTIGIAGGFWFVVHTLRTFSGFATPLCVLFASILWVYQGLQFGVFAWLVARCDARGLPRLAAVPLAWVGLELLYPCLFPWYFGCSLHIQPVLIQTADLGGPLLVSGLMVLGHGALAESAWPAGERSRWPQGFARWKPLAVAVGVWLAAVAYGSARLAQVDAQNRTTPTLRVGLVQENLGLNEQRTSRTSSLHRHLEVSRSLQADGVDLSVWSEAAMSYPLPEGELPLRELFPDWDLTHPVLFGGLSLRDQHYFNTAYLADAQGVVQGHYDKTYLLAFGEYIPFGETFPQFYQWSPNSGHLHPGTRQVPLTFRHPRHGEVRLLPLICYEDILPRFVRSFQASVDAHAMVVILNDAWFGETNEPWIHMALSRFRAVEHRRDLVRAANSGVSAFIDAGGRLGVHSGIFTRERPVGVVHLRTGGTVYGVVGDAFGWLALAFVLWGAFVRKPK